MDKKKKLTVKEIKEIEPKADVYELNKFYRYMIMIKKSSILDASGKDTTRAKGEIIMKLMTELELPCAVLLGVDDDVKFLEMK